jgi:release factor glutamine methyltransferase
MQILTALQLIHSRLAPLSDTPAMDAQILLAHILGEPRPWIIAHSEASLSVSEISTLEKDLMRMEDGLPLPYLIGKWEFFGLAFKVNQAVLIPRPETEAMVEWVLKWIKSHPSRRLGIDIGTGSGCIAVSLLANTKDLVFIASDISPDALHLARQNAQIHHVAQRISFVQSELFPATCTRYDIICANLPYIPNKTLKSLPVYGREPTIALNGGRDGLKLIKPLIQTAPRYLAEGGILLCEIEAGQGKSVRSLAQKTFPGLNIQILPDLAGHDRLLIVDGKR